MSFDVRCLLFVIDCFVVCCRLRFCVVCGLCVACFFDQWLLIVFRCLFVCRGVRCLLSVVVVRCCCSLCVSCCLLLFLCCLLFLFAVCARVWLRLVFSWLFVLLCVLFGVCRVSLLCLCGVYCW